MPARVMRAADAPTYNPPLHHDVEARRLQGLEAGPTEAFWQGLSYYAPGASVDASETAAECVYFIVSGELVITVDGTEHTLTAGDSVHFTKGTLRSVDNRSAGETQLLVTIALPRD